MENTQETGKEGQHTQKQDVRTLKNLKALHFPGLHKSHYFPPALPQHIR